MAYSHIRQILPKKPRHGSAVFLSTLSDNLSRQLSPSLLIYLLIGFTVVLAGVLLIPDNPKDYLILISAIAIIISVLLTSAVTLHSQMRDRSFELLKTNRDDDNYKNAMSTFVRFLRQNPNLTRKDIIDIYLSQEPEVIAVRDAIKTTGNFFEEMATAIFHKEVNEPLLREFYIGIFVRYYQGVKQFLPVIRNEVPERPFGQDTIRSEIYIRLDELYERWHPIYNAMIEDIRNARNSTSTENTE